MPVAALACTRTVSSKGAYPDELRENDLSRTPNLGHRERGLVAEARGARHRHATIRDEPRQAPGWRISTPARDLRSALLEAWGLSGPDGRVLDYGDLPIIVVSKDPISQVLSWFRLARHVTLISGSARLRPFITGPMELTQDYTTTGSIRYRFGRPAHYWNQFYFAAASLQRTGVPVHFVNYEQVVVSPACAVQSIACFLSLPPPTGLRRHLAGRKARCQQRHAREEFSTVRDDRAFDVEHAIRGRRGPMGWRNAEPSWMISMTMSSSQRAGGTSWHDADLSLASSRIFVPLWNSDRGPNSSTSSRSASRSHHTTGAPFGGGA